MKNKHDSRAADTREMILHAARAIFSQHPYRSASIRGIATRGGFYHGLIRYHFPSKAAIFDAVAQEACAKLKEANRAWLAEVTALAPREGLSLYLDRFIGHYRSHPETFRIITQNFSQEDAQGVPGYENLTDLLSETRADFEKNLPGLFDKDLATMFLESFNALILHYLGSASSEARLLKLDPESPRYLQWVKDTMMFLFLPVLERFVAAEM